MAEIVHTPVEAREAVHVLLLNELGRIGGGQAVILKGGVNLRLFFASLRYSEDMDLDGEPGFSPSIREAIRSTFDDHRFLARLRTLGLRGLDPGEGANKDTETVFRYKFHVVGRGDIRYPTKVEVSFRARDSRDGVLAEDVPSAWIDKYIGDRSSLRVAHYDRPAAVRQKIEALAGRTIVQARDVFDLYTLGLRQEEVELIAHVSMHVNRERLKEAGQRVYGITFEECEGQVVEFLTEDAREKFGNRTAWDEVRLEVAGAVDAALSHVENRQ